MTTIRETFMASEYEIRTQVRSRIADGKMQRVTVGIGCPHCHTANIGGYPGHGKTTACRKCGLKMTRWGNALDCEMKE